MTLAQARRPDRAWLVTLVLLSLAFALFFVLPFAGMLNRGLRHRETWDIITSQSALTALRLSLWTSTVTVIIAIGFGTPLAYLMAHASFRGKSIVDALIDLPIVLPPTVAGVALLTAFGRRGLIGSPIDDWTGFTFGFRTTAVIMAQLLVAAPFFVRAAKSGFEAIDPQYERVAFTLGAGRARTFFRITLPQAWPAILAGIVLCWARAMGELGATLIFAGSLEGTTQTMPLAILGAFEGSSLGLDGAIALSLILLAVALAVLWLFRVAVARSPLRL